MLHERASVLSYTYTIFPVQIKYQMQLLQSRCMIMHVTGTPELQGNIYINTTSQWL